MYDIELGIALSYSTVSPYDLKECIAGWIRETPNPFIVKTGFVVEVVDGRFAYITTERDPQRAFSANSTQWFKEEPKHLYQRAVSWEFDREKLNAGKHSAKQEAKYPNSNSVTVSIKPDSRGVVRIPF